MPWSNLADAAVNSVTGAKFWVSTVSYPGMFETIITAKRGFFGAGSKKNWRWTAYAFFGDQETARGNHTRALALALEEDPASWTIAPAEIEWQRKRAITMASANRI